MHILLTGLILWTLASVASAQMASCNSSTVTAAQLRVFDKNNRFKPVVSVEDVFQVRICGGGAAAFAHISAINAISNTHELRNCSWQRSRAPRCRFGEVDAKLPRPKLDTCARDQTNCYAQVFVRKDISEKQPKTIIPFGASGGPALGGLIQHLGGQGHYEITGRAVTAFALKTGRQMGQSALLIMQDASQDADFYEWQIPAAHAQLDFDKKSLMLLQSSDEGKASVIQWVRKVLSMRVLPACQQKNDRLSAYWIGYAMHSVQDFVFHEGMSNPEHAMRDLDDGNKVDVADHYEAKMIGAEKITGMYLSAVDAWLVIKQQKTCLSNALARSTGTVISQPEKKQFFKSGWTLKASSYLDFKSQGIKLSQLLDGLNGQDAPYVLRPKWIGWDQLPKEGYPAEVEPKIATFVQEMFDRF